MEVQSNSLLAGYDKLGFVAHIFEQLDTIVYFGNNPDEMLVLMRPFYPSAKLVSFAYKGLSYTIHSPNNTETTSSLDRVRELSGMDRSLLVLDMIMSDVYALPNGEGEQLLFQLFDMGFTYITARDFYLTGCTTERAFRNRKNVDTINKCIENLRINNVRQVADFEKIYGPLISSSSRRVLDFKNLVHFLLKVRYRDEWEKELKTDYSNPDRKWFFLPVEKYDLSYSRSYVLPYVQEINKADYDIDLKLLGVTTHVRTVYTKRPSLNTEGGAFV